MAKYRKKSVVIEAIRLLPSTLSPYVEEFLGEAKNFPDCSIGGIDPSDGQFKIKTPEGVMIANVGDWIIKGVKGEFYPCKPDIFEITYELMDNDRSQYVKNMEEFHYTFEVPISHKPRLLPSEDFIRRLTLITSEVGELGDAVRRKDIVEIADALGDLLYVTFGMAIEMGLDIDKVFDEIHKSNMTKIWPDGKVHRDEGGKVLKPDTYTPVNLGWLVNHLNGEQHEHQKND